MKIASALFALCFATGLFAQAAIPVFLEPSDESIQIGELETASLAVPAVWPEGIEHNPAFQPVYYRGTFEVFVRNNDVAKDLTAKPGSPYFLEPDAESVPLSIATEKDKVDILGVDTWFCQMQLETILVGYIPNGSIEAQSIVTSLGNQPTNLVTPTTPVPDAIKDFVGILQKTGMLGKGRTGADFKLTDPAGKTIAFLDLSKVPDRVQIDQLIGQSIRVSGSLKEAENNTDVIVLAQRLKASN